MRVTDSEHSSERGEISWKYFSERREMRTKKRRKDKRIHNAKQRKDINRKKTIVEEMTRVA